MCAHRKAVVLRHRADRLKIKYCLIYGSGSSFRTCKGSWFSGFSDRYASTIALRKSGRKCHPSFRDRAMPLMVGHDVPLLTLPES